MYVKDSLITSGLLNSSNNLVEKLVIKTGNVNMVIVLISKPPDARPQVYREQLRNIEFCVS